MTLKQWRKAIEGFVDASGQSVYVPLCAACGRPSVGAGFRWEFVIFGESVCWECFNSYLVTWIVANVRRAAREGA